MSLAAALLKPPACSCFDPFLQTFNKSVEQAKEVWDRREGKRPATRHNPTELLDPSTWSAEEKVW